MPIVSTTYWNMVFGFDAEQARQAKAAGIEKPGEEPRVWTHFIR